MVHLHVSQNLMNLAYRVFNRIFNFITTIYAKILFHLWNVSYGTNLKVHGWIKVRNLGFITIGDNCFIDSRKIRVGFNSYSLLRVAKNAKLTIGNNVGMTNCHFHCFDSITVMDYTIIGAGCQFLDTNVHELNFLDRNNKKKNIKKKQIIIGKYIFIGTSCFILKGVEIEDYAVIGAGSVVTKKIRKNEIWAGNPAKFIKFVPEQM